MKNPLYFSPGICFSSDMITRDKASEIYEAGKDAVVDKLQELSAEIDRLKGLSPDSPTTPSGQKPPFLKKDKKKRGKKPGQKPGHKGASRSALRPEDAHKTIHHYLVECPHCQTSLAENAAQTRNRVIEDIPDVTIEVVNHVLERKWCPCCKKQVEAPMTEALPGSVIGIRLAVFSAFLHYFVGVSLRNIKLLLQVSSGHKVSIGGLFQIWERLAGLLEVEYDRIASQIRTAKVVGGDETGWRIAGKLSWLWTFVTEDACIYLIEPFRNGKVVKRFLGKKFNGILTCDFWGAYNKVHAAYKQRCLYHLFTELKKVDNKEPSEDWKIWRKSLSRVLKDAIRLSRKYGKIPVEDYYRLQAYITGRFEAIITATSSDADVKRLCKRLLRHKEEIFTFLDNPAVSPYNNLAERSLRPSVLMRKISQQNRSLKAARVQAILMTLFRTAHVRGQNPFETVLEMTKNLIAPSLRLHSNCDMKEKLAA